MKKWKLIMVFCSFNVAVSAQSFEIQQLLLNVEKLSQFKAILQNMYDGYKVLHKGYTTIKDISAGNFSLHKGFLDALLEVSPAVRKYKRIADIFNYQVRLVKEYKAAFIEFKNGDMFTHEEIGYLEKVYANLFKESLESLDELMVVITSGKLRMSDDERLQAIDRIYAKVEDQFAFLKEFNGNTTMLALQRKSEKADINLLKKLRDH
ncbi:MAG: TerB family tellurite resistance protein [Proteobacteria bacterium]|nr:MAG: TerB family tellurite resistance protein [Pseudomonadota bacterium]